MQLRTFTVPFSKVAGPDATELEFGPDDSLVVRPLFTLSRGQATALNERIAGVQKRGREVVGAPADDPARLAAEAEADQLVLDVIRAACVEWHLTGPDGEPIPIPSTTKALDELPAGLAAALFPFLTNYRGEDPNPGTRS